MTAPLPSTTFAPTSGSANPRHQDRLALIKSHLVNPVTGLYDPPARMRDKPPLQQMFIAELADACLQELPDASAAVIEHILTEAKRSLVRTYGRSVWPVPGIVAEHVQTAARAMRKTEPIAAPEHKALPAPSMAAPAPITVERLRGWVANLVPLEGISRGVYGWASAWLHRHGCLLPDGSVTHDPERAWRAAGMDNPPRWSAGRHKEAAE